MSEEQQPAGWVPAFEGQRPPFEPGNQLAVGHGRPLVHGIWSARTVDPIAAQYLEAVLADDSVLYLREPRYRPALAAWAQAEARLMLFERWVAGMPVEKQASAPAGRILRWSSCGSWTSRRRSIGIGWG